MLNYELPHDLLAEKSLLGCLLIDSQSYEDVISYQLKKSDFHDGSHALVFSAIDELYKNRCPIDYVTVCGKLKDRGNLSFLGGGDEVLGTSYLVNLIEEQASAVHVGYYAKIVKEKATLRSIVKTALEIASEASTYSDDFSIFKNEIEAKFLNATKLEKGQDFCEMPDLSKSFLEFLDDPRSEENRIDTGYWELDQKLKGLRPGKLILVAARPGVGKTALILNIVMDVLKKASLKKRDLPVAIFSLEMMAQELLLRFASSESGIDAGMIQEKKLRPTERQKVEDAVRKFRNFPIFIDDGGGNTIHDIQSKCRRLKNQRGLGLVVIDYVQLMSTHTKTTFREQQVAEISRGLKQLSKELDCPVIALSQLNRALESRQNKRPSIADLRESGSLEQDADTILLLHKEETEPGKVEIIIGKNRGGGTGSVNLRWTDCLTRFDNFC